MGLFTISVACGVDAGVIVDAFDCGVVGVDGGGGADVGGGGYRFQFVGGGVGAAGANGC